MNSRMSRRETFAATALLVCLAAQALHFAWVKSSTYDESEHVAAGYYALTLGDFDVDHQHPPLARMWCALPLIGLRDLGLPTDRPDAYRTPALFWGPIFMWEVNRDGPFLTWLTRLPMVALTLVAASVVYAWARSLYGRRSGLVALLCCAFSPAVLASGSLATTDLPAAAFSVLSGYAVWLWLRRPCLWRGILAGAAIGMALASKLSALYLAPALLVLVIVWWATDRANHQTEPRPSASTWRGLSIFVLGLAAALFVLPTGAAAGLALGAWVGWFTHRWQAGGTGAALACMRRTLPAAACCGVLVCALSRAMTWAATVVPLGVVVFDWSGRIRLVAVGFAASWLILRYTGVPRLLTVPNWASLGRWPVRWAVVGAVAVSVLWASYGFDFRPRQGDDTVPWLRLRSLPGDLPRLAAAALWAAHDRRLPLRAYWSGLELVRRLHEGSGHGCRMLGRVYHVAPWYYFPLAVATKTPCGFLVLFAMASALALHPAHWPRRDELPLLIPPLVYLGIVLQSHMTVGVRHLLPLYVFAFVWASRLVRRGRGARWLNAVVCALLVWQAASVWQASPHYLAYFNELAGGVTHGADWFRDSNVDWGQDLRLLARYQAAHPKMAPMGLAYFGTAAPGAYGVHSPPIPLNKPWPGYVAVSVTLLDEAAPEQSWLRARPVAAYIGGSIRVYGPAP